MNPTRRVSLRLTPLIAALAAPAAYAQQAPEPAASAAVLADIVVTAEKRSEALQKVPLSIAAFSGDALAERGVDDFASLAARIPGVVLNSAGPGQSSYSIRGIASVGGNAPTTGFYVDETPLIPSGGDGATATVEPDLFDLARIEVLRGPQGTLYGASSMGGTVRLITNQPNLTREEAAAAVDGSDTAHGGGNIRVDGMLNLPLVDGRAALRMVGTYKDYSGFIDREVGVWAPNPNVPTGFPAYPVSPSTASAIVRDVNAERVYSGRVILKVAVNDQLTVTPSIWVQDLQMGGPPDFDIPSGQSSGPLIQARPFNVSEAYSDHFELTTLNVNYDLGWGSVLSNTAYMHREETNPDDETEALEDNFPQGKFVANAYSPIVTTRELTEELRLAINPTGSPLTGVVGAYFNNANRHYFVNYLTPGYAQLFANTYTTQTLLAGVALSDVNYSQHGDYAPKQSALFAEFNYAITERLKATAGIRWYDMQYTSVRYEDGWSNGGPTVSSGVAKNTGINPKAELSWQATDDRLYYATVSKGVRPGGVNTSNLTERGCGQDYAPYGPDSVWNYEAGAKTRWLGGALTVNGAAYYIKWDGVQQGETLPCSYQVTENAGTAVVHGAELEVEGQIGRHLHLSAGVGYTKAVLAADAPSLGGLSGQQLENVPLWNGNASVKYAFTLQGGYDAFLRADGRYVGESYPDFARNDPATFQTAYALVDLRTGLLRGPWEANLYLSNALDKQAHLSEYLSDNYAASTRVRMYTNQPRTIGLSLKWKF